MVEDEVVDSKRHDIGRGESGINLQTNLACFWNIPMMDEVLGRYLVDEGRFITKSMALGWPSEVSWCANLS